MKPKVSVIMSVTTVKPQYLKEAIASILRQTFTEFEFIIVDDALSLATKKTVQRFTDPRIKVYRNPQHLGLTKSLNVAIKKAHGSYLARMDADDIALPHRLKVQVAYLNQHPKIAGCGSAVVLINAKGSKLGIKRLPRSPSEIRDVIMRYPPFIHPTMMLRTKIVKAIGGYDEVLDGAEDYDLWLRLLQAYDLTNLPHVLLRYRIHAQGVSWSKLKRMEWQALRARVKALRSRSYPWWQGLYLVKPALSFLIPSRIKRSIFGI